MIIFMKIHRENLRLLVKFIQIQQATLYGLWHQENMNIMKTTFTEWVNIQTIHKNW